MDDRDTKINHEKFTNISITKTNMGAIMKNIYFKILSFIMFTALMIANIVVLNQNVPTAQANASLGCSGGGATCYSSFNSCWINCDRFWLCNPDCSCDSEQTKGDNKSDQGSCH